MAKKQKVVSLVAHVTVRGLESLKRGQIDLSDSRLDGSPGTVQLELHMGRKIARQLEHEIKAAQALFGNNGALQHLDEAYIKPWQVKVALVTSGNPEVDDHIQQAARIQGYQLHVASS